ncbi:MAG TPA: S8 family serine peptidase [Planctomycetota bacterium]
MSSRRIVMGVAALLISASAAMAQETRVIVIFHDTPDEGVVTKRGGTVELRSDRSRMVAAHVAPNKVAEIAAEEGVASVVEDCEARIPVGAEARPDGVGNGGGGGAPQPAEVTPWGIDRIDAPAAWLTTVGAGVRIAIVDTGIKSDHEDFKDAGGSSRVVLGPNFVNAAKTSKDDNGHGTHCAGIAGASDNAIGVIGVAPGCTLVAVKVLDRQGSGWLSAVIAGIDWAADNAEIISMSLGTTSNISAMEDSVNAAVGQGVVVVAAGGNEGQVGNPPLYPAAYASVIAVAATDSSDAVAAFSTRGSYIDIAAPGVSIFSTWKDGYYATLSGTSMATPHVAGAAALLRASGLTAVADIRAALLSTADDVNSATLPGVDSAIGNGLLDVEEAVTGGETLP